MKTIASVLMFSLLTVVNAVAGIPEIEELEKDERVVISLMYSEPKITIYLFVFELGTVTIREDGKLLGKLTISEQEAIKIDHFLYTVRRGKKASRSTLGAPLYRITHETSGQKAGEWSFHITSTKETSKPTLSLRELMTRAEQK